MSAAARYKITRRQQHNIVTICRGRHTTSQQNIENIVNISPHTYSWTINFQLFLDNIIFYCLFRVLNVELNKGNLRIFRLFFVFFSRKIIEHSEDLSQGFKFIQLIFQNTNEGNLGIK